MATFKIKYFSKLKVKELHGNSCYNNIDDNIFPFN